jgi:hypothetical protein
MRTSELAGGKMNGIGIILGLCLLVALLILLMLIIQSGLTIVPTLVIWALQLLLVIVVLIVIILAAAYLIKQINTLMKRIESIEASHQQLKKQMKKGIPWFFTAVTIIATASMFIVDKAFPGEHWEVIIIGITLIILFGFANGLFAAEKTRWLGMLVWYAALFLPPALILQTHSVTQVIGDLNRFGPTLIFCLVCSILVVLAAPFFPRTA